MNAQNRQTEKLVAEVEKLRVRIDELEYQNSHLLEQLKEKEGKGRPGIKNTGTDKSVASLLDISDHINKEKELAEQEKLIKTVMDNLPVGIAVNSVLPSVDFLYMNDNFPRIYRTTREELSSSDRFWDAVYEDPVFRARMKKRVLDDIASGDPGRMKWENIPISRKGEDTSYISAYNTPVPERGLMISTVIDVTEQKQAETALRESEARFRMLAESAPVGIIISDKNHKTVYASRRFTEIVGYTIEDVPSVEQWWPLAYPDEKERSLVNEQWNKTIAQLQNNPSGINPVEFPVRCKDGTFRQIEFRLSTNSGFYYVILTDMTERKKAEEELRKLKDNLEAVTEEQTRELKEKVSELERFHKATIDREFRIKELRDEVERLRAGSGEWK